MIVILIISNLIFLFLVFYLFRINKKNKRILHQQKNVLKDDEEKLHEISDERHVLEMEIEFLKGIYRSKLLNLEEKKAKAIKSSP